MSRRIRRTLAVAVGSGALAAGALVWVPATTPGVASLAGDDPSTTSFVERVRAAGRPASWEPVPLDRISSDLVLAVLVGEDVRFFEHRGFDRIEIAAAAREALLGKRLRGASTLTQQLARNVWLSRRRTPTRKLREAILAARLERALTKRRILELHLNTAIWGASTIGAEAAARRYFGISAAELSREQAARLAATLPAPEHWYPGSGSPRAERHYRRILERMDWPLGLRERLVALGVDVAIPSGQSARQEAP